MSRLHQMSCLGAMLLWTALLGLPAWAQEPAPPDIDALQAAAETARTRAAAIEVTLRGQREAAATLAGEIERLTGATADLEQAQAEALAAMRGQFERIVADPTLDLTEAQTRYRLAGVALRQHQDGIAAREQEAVAAAAAIAGTERQLAEAGDRVTALQREFDAARVARLHRELNVTGEISLGNTITCRPDETIAGCTERGQDEARAQAQRVFVERVYAAVTEAGVVARNRDGVRGEQTLLDSRITDSGFRGQGDYEVALTAKVSNRAKVEEACTLLGIAPADCTAEPAPPPAAAAEPPPPAEEPVAAGEHLLTVRSNVRLDEVYIDGIPYGSTKVDVLLPAGEYDVEVRKPGHQTYAQRVRLDRPTTVKAELAVE